MALLEMGTQFFLIRDPIRTPDILDAPTLAVVIGSDDAMRRKEEQLGAKIRWGEDVLRFLRKDFIQSTQDELACTDSTTSRSSDCIMGSPRSGT